VFLKKKQDFVPASLVKEQPPQEDTSLRRLSPKEETVLSKVGGFMLPSPNMMIFYLFGICQSGKS
jgi:hypothetical protein